MTNLRKLAKNIFWPIGLNSIFIYTTAITLAGMQMEKRVYDATLAEMQETGKREVTRRYDLNRNGLEFLERCEIWGERTKREK